MKTTYFYILALLALLSFVATAPTDEQKGYTIAEQVQKQLKGFGKYSAKMEMIIARENGKQYTREIDVFVMEEPNHEEKTINIFRNPADVKGTKLLTYSYPKESDDQWIFLPALHKTKRIANENKSGPFLGSEFAYEDLGNNPLQKFTYRFIKETAYNGVDCYLIQGFPVNKYSAYSYIEMYINKANMLTVAMKYYDKKKELLKSREGEYKNFGGKFWLPTRMTMKNEQNGRSSTVLWKDYNFQLKMTGNDFSINAFEKLN